MNILSPFDILLPPFAPTSEEWRKYSVIACDQFTSEPEYWEACEALTADSLSAYNLVMPEAYLGKAKEELHRLKISSAMRKYPQKLTKYESSFVYVERTLPSGAIRRGLVGAVDLEAYDYREGSSSPIRATEATVLERIPPRVKIRESAEIELPHIMIFVSADGDAIIDAAAKASAEVLYDFELNLGGGHIKGKRVPGDSVALGRAIAEYESRHAGGVAYAMGDGNHSLASAKAHYEKLKKKLGDGAALHPARYALAEIVSLGDRTIVFEPIYRLIKAGAAAEEFISYARASEGEVPVTLIGDFGSCEIGIPAGSSHVTCGSVDEFLARFTAEHPDVSVDYIHGRDSLEALSVDGSFGILTDCPDNASLIPYIEKWGTLPKKTFSMGEAKSKRYYLEARFII